MAFDVRFLCTECGYEMDVDLDDPEMKHIVCPVKNCKHHAPKPNEEFLGEIRADRRMRKILQGVAAFVLILFFASAIFAIRSVYENYSLEAPAMTQETQIGLVVAGVSAAALIVLSFKIRSKETFCEF